MYVGLFHYHLSGMKEQFSACEVHGVGRRPVRLESPLIHYIYKYTVQTPGLVVQCTHPQSDLAEPEPSERRRHAQRIPLLPSFTR